MADAMFLPLEKLRPGQSPEVSGAPSTSERLFQILGDVAPGLLWIVDTNGRFIYTNRAWEKYTGSDLDQLNAVGWEGFNHPDELGAVRLKWTEAIAQGGPFEMELRYRRSDGEYRWMLARVVPLRDGEGEIQNWVGTSVDIEDLKRAQAELSRSQRDLGDYFETASIGLQWLGPDGTILRVNQAELDLLGYTKDDFIGRNIREFHDDRDVIEDMLRRLTLGEVLHNYPARLRCKDGSIKHVMIDSSAFFDDGQFQHTRCFTRDVSIERQVGETSARLAAIVTSSTDAIIGKTLDGVVTSWNAAAERIFGYTETEMVGQPIYRLIPEEYHDAERVLLAQIGRGDAVEVSEAGRVTKDGRRIRISISVSPIRDSQDRVIGASSIKRDVTESKLAAETLRQSQERLQLALKAARMGTWRWDVSSNVLSWDEGLENLYDLAPGEKVTRYEQFIERVHQDDRAFVESSVARALHAGGLDYEFRIVLPNGRVRWLADQGHVARDQAGNLIYMTGVCLDVTDRKHAEERLRQAQRMESVGQLAGGIAHEANNMMSVVLGCADYVLQRSDLSEPVRQDVAQIWKAAKRTAGVTQQLLAFSRRQVLQPQVLDLNATVRGLEPILTRTLGESSGLRMHLSVTLGRVRADPGQLEQVLINLTLNARDAMQDGGRLTIETMNVLLDPRYVAGKPVETLKPGEYAALIVTDTGHGMDRETLGRVFEPFFTTKGVGQGTGLGLSTVYGIVKQSGGFIWAYSEPGLGTTFKLYFPLVPIIDDELIDAPETTPPAHPDEVVLIAEDEPMVRGIMARTLRDSGYGVLEAADGKEALEIVEARGGDVSLVVADVVMPGLGGREMAARIAQRWPRVSVLFTSGYTGLDVVRRGLMEEGREFIQKPLAPEALIRKVRQMVDEKVPGP